MRYKNLIYAIPLAFAMTFSSCVKVDKEFDLDHIDGTVGVGGKHAAFPLGSSEKYYLKDIFEDENSNSNNLESRDGNYYFVSKNSLKETEVDIDLNLSSKDIESTAKSSISLPSGTPTGRELTLEGLPGVSMDLHSTMKLDTKDDRLVELAQVSLENKTLSLQFGMVDGQFESLTFKNVEFKFPKYIRFDSSRLPEGFTLKQTDDGATLSAKQLICHRNKPIIFGFSELRFADKWDDGKNHPAEDASGIKIESLSKGIDFNCVIKSEKLDITKGSFNSTSPSLQCDAHIDGKFDVKSVSAKVKFESTQRSEYLFDNFPSALDKERTMINPTNLAILLECNNTIAGLSFDIDATLSTVDNKNSINVSGIHFDTGHNKVVISKAKYVGECTQNKLVENIESLIQPIPDKLNAEFILRIKPDKFVTIKPNMHIEGVTTDYEIPFQFEEGTQIGYRDTLDIGEINEDKVEIKRAKLHFVLESVVPFSIEFLQDYMKLLNSDNQELKNVKITLEKGFVQGSKDGKTPVSSEVVIVLDDPIGDQIAKLNSLTFESKAMTTGMGIFLREDQWLRGKKLYLELPGGVIIKDDSDKEDNKND
ncbi:hypothetical protein [Falsiporphyromonas endometrii]|uniref:Lipoprotein n=1 Tax=Falsiporphyromonas endometrii TaxID=1387297 RepID=A0ABV9K6D4_9PORP